MRDLAGWLWTVGIFAAVGKATDFLIGCVGQERARGFLETWWIKFDDVRWNNFGQKEALFSVYLIDVWFGRQFFSWRRWILIYAFFSVSIVCGHILAISQSTRGLSLPLIIAPPAFVTVPLSAVGLAVSLSLTRLIAVTVARLCTDGKLRNFIIFTIFFGITYFLLAIWVPVFHLFSILVIDRIISTILVTHSLNDAMINARSFLRMTIMHPEFYLVSPQSIAQEFLYGANLASVPATFREQTLPFLAVYFTQVVAGYVAYLVRLIMAIVFVGSFIVKPILMKPMSLIWRRLVESEKPIFTFILGSIAALTQLCSELVKHIL